MTTGGDQAPGGVTGPDDWDDAAVERFRNYAELVVHGRSALRADALAIAAAALAAVDPAAALRAALRLEGDELAVTDPAGGERHVFDLRGRRLFVLGAGKASVGMAMVLDELLGARLSDGAVVVKRGQAEPLRHIEVLEAAHPVPDEASLRGGLRLLEIAQAAGPDDLLLALVTGGSSALAVAPAEGISLADTAETGRVLLASGADIVSINDVRKHLSRIKGGRLGRLAGCEIVNFTVSDVVGDPLDYITDLTVPDRSTFADAAGACDRFGLWDELPRAVVEHLRRADPADDTCHELEDVTSFVMADARMMCDAAARAAAGLGYQSEVLRLDLEGESAAAGAWFAARVAAAPSGVALVAGGETTTTLGAAGVTAAGGPSQEAALAGAIRLGSLGRDDPGACLLYLDSDGTDGPTDAAGALVDDVTAEALAAAGTDAAGALASHRAGAALASLADVVLTGPTGTNVNDLKIGLTAGALPREE